MSIGFVENNVEAMKKLQQQFEGATVLSSQRVAEIGNTLTECTSKLGEKIACLEVELGKKTSELVTNVSELKTEIGQNKSSVDAQISHVSRETARFRREANDAMEGLTKSVEQMQVAVAEARAASSKPTSSLDEDPAPGVPIQNIESPVSTSSDVAAIAPPVVPPAMPDPSITPSSLPAPPDSSPSPTPAPLSVTPDASVSTGPSPGGSAALPVEDPSSSAASPGSDGVEKDQSFMSEETIDRVLAKVGVSEIFGSLRSAYRMVFGKTCTFNQDEVRIAMGKMKYPVHPERKPFPTELSPGVDFDHLWFTGGGDEKITIMTVMRKFSEMKTSLDKAESVEKAWTCILAQFLSFDEDNTWAKGVNEQLDSDPESS